MIDMQTIIISYIVTNLVCASIMTLLWLQNRKRFYGIGFWMGNYVAICIGFVLIALRGVIPDFLSIVIANAAIVYGIVLLHIGLERFLGKSKSQIHNYILLTIFILVHAWFTYAQPSLLARNINISVALFIFACQIAWLIFRRLDITTSASLRSIGIISVFFCLVSIARITIDLMIDPGNNFLKTGSDSFMILIYQTLQIGIALSLFLQVNRRLVVDLENDIIERKRAEEALQASETLYRQLFANHSAVMLLLEPESGLIVKANLAAVNFYGYPTDTLQRMSIQQVNILPPEQIARLRQDVQTGKINYFSVPHRLASGEIRQVEVHSVPIEVNKRALLYSIIHDITERKRAEDALQESRKIAEELFEFTPDALLTVDQIGRITRANQQAQNLFGYTREELLSQRIDILIPQRYQSKHAQDMVSFFAQPYVRPMSNRMELFALRRNEREFPVDILLSPLQLGGKTFVTAVIRDISARKQAEEALRETQMQIIEQQRTLATLEERERVSRELHDGIGQVLAYVNVQAQAAQMLLEKNQPDVAKKNLEEIVQVAQDAHANLRHTILGLRDSVAPQPDFAQALQAYLNSFRQAWGVETVFSPPQDKLPVLPAGVEDQLLHIVQEALVNIRKHAQAQRAEVLISLRPGEMILIISDDGCGFDPQFAPGAEREHFGLGIMRERAGQIGGRVEIRSVVGQGTKLFVYIPTAFSPKSNENSKDVYSLRILLVDDQPLFLDGMRNLLAARGLTVIGTARDGLEAIEQVETLHPDIVLMDVNMPNCDGIQATRRIKARFPETQVVLLTVSEDDDHLLDAVKYGAAGYLLKSLNANQLFSTLDGLARGEIQIAPELAARLLNGFNHAGTTMLAENNDETIPAELTMRQWEVLRLVARGLTYKEAGHELSVTEAAIKYHMAQILERLQLKNREQAVTYLRRAQEAHKKKDTHI